MPFFRGIDVRIKIQDQPTEEWQVEETNDRIESFIESRAGQNFSISVNRGSALSGHHLSCRIYCDSIRMSSLLLQTGRIQGQRKGNLIGAQGFRPFQFSRIKLSDEEDQVMTNETIVKALGTIEVHIHRVLIRPKSGFGEVKPCSDSTAMTFDEKSKKATLAHCAGLSAQVQDCNPCKSFSTKDLDPLPVQVFRFKYRSRDLLEAQGIAPARARPQHTFRPPPPVATVPAGSPAASSISSTANEDLQNALSKVKQENEELRRTLVKVEREDDDEIQSMPAPKRQKINYGVVDLTADTDEE